MEGATRSMRHTRRAMQSAANRSSDARFRASCFISKLYILHGAESRAALRSPGPVDLLSAAVLTRLGFYKHLEWRVIIAVACA
jgi:hypothetical protein